MFEKQWLKREKQSAQRLERTLEQLLQQLLKQLRKQLFKQLHKIAPFDVSELTDYVSTWTVDKQNCMLIDFAEEKLTFLPPHHVRTKEKHFSSTQRCITNTTEIIHVRLRVYTGLIDLILFHFIFFH